LELNLFGIAQETLFWLCVYGMSYFPRRAAGGGSGEIFSSVSAEGLDEAVGECFDLETAHIPISESILSTKNAPFPNNTVRLTAHTVRTIAHHRYVLIKLRVLDAAHTL
jgi:hypothetical protein